MQFIYCLNGMASKGAVREIYFAHTKGIPITESLSMLEKFRSEMKRGN